MHDFIAPQVSFNDEYQALELTRGYGDKFVAIAIGDLKDVRRHLICVIQVQKIIVV
jgi:hypothetical protein